jgi:hypothetical protein
MLRCFNVMLIFISCCFLSEATGKVSHGINQQDSMTVRHSAKMTTDKVYAKQNRYFTELLHLALNKSAVPYTIKAITFPRAMDSRYSLMFEKGMFDVIWMHTTKEYEKKFTPIRIPLFKGLIGWRILLIREADKEKFANINSLGALRALPVGQGFGWPDTNILRAAGFNVLTAMQTAHLYSMLRAKRTDYFPRSIIEVHNELEHNNANHLVIDTNLALRYPTAFYFFVKKDNHKLANAIEKGLIVAIKDGSFNNVFYQYFGQNIKQSQFNNRKIFHIQTPESSFSHLPTEVEELWFSANDLPPSH